jgi:hypothetical protein
MLACSILFHIFEILVEFASAQSVFGFDMTIPKEILAHSLSKELLECLTFLQMDRWTRYAKVQGLYSRHFIFFATYEWTK